MIDTLIRSFALRNKPRFVQITAWHSGILQPYPYFAESESIRHNMQDESSLLRRLNSLDPETITWLHQRFYPEVYRYAHYRIGNVETAEDIASEAFLRLLDAIHNGKGPRSSRAAG